MTPALETGQIMTLTEPMPDDHDNYTVVESFTLGKRCSEGYSEDRLIIEPNICAVVDGSRGTGPLGERDFTDLLDEFSDVLAKASSSNDPSEIIASLSLAMKQAKEGFGIRTLAGTGAITLAAYHAPTNMVLRLGDCHAAVDGEVFDRAWHVEAIGSTARSVFIEAALKCGKSPETIMASSWYATLFDPILEAQLHFTNDTNHRFGFGAIDGQSASLHFLESFPLDGFRNEVVLASDGYLGPAASLRIAESELEEALQEDPMCIGRNIGPKGLGPNLRSYDDRTYVRIRLDRTS